MPKKYFLFQRCHERSSILVNVFRRRIELKDSDISRILQPATTRYVLQVTAYTYMNVNMKKVFEEKIAYL